VEREQYISENRQCEGEIHTGKQHRKTIQEPTDARNVHDHIFHRIRLGKAFVQRLGQKQFERGLRYADTVDAPNYCFQKRVCEGIENRNNYIKMRRIRQRSSKQNRVGIGMGYNGSFPKSERKTYNSTNLQQQQQQQLQQRKRH